MAFPAPQGPWTWARDWLVFSAEPGDQISMCDDRSVYNEETSTPMSMVGYPPSMSFEAVDGLACEYKGDEKTLGSLACRTSTARVSMCLSGASKTTRPCPGGCIVLGVRCDGEVHRYIQ
jgi:hypothetical protein